MPVWDSYPELRLLPVWDSFPELWAMPVCESASAVLT